MLPIFITAIITTVLPLASAGSRWGVLVTLLTLSRIYPPQETQSTPVDICIRLLLHSWASHPELHMQSVTPLGILQNE